MSQKPVVIIGGGPAGCICGALLAQEGLETLLFEKSKHPRHHVGESLQPATIDILDRHLGVGKQIAQQGFARKYGAVYRWGESTTPWRILFDPRLEACVDDLTEEQLFQGDYEMAWQVKRSALDKIIFDAAVEKGLQAKQNCRVSEVLFDGAKAVGVVLENGQRIETSFIIDASGQRALIGRKLGLIDTAADLKSIAHYGYFKGAGGLPGPLSRHVQFVAAVPEGWVWFIPISKEITSIGLVTKEKRTYDKDSLKALFRASDIPIGDGDYCEVDGQSGVSVIRDWSYSARRFVGSGYALVGDAACFVDPILSGGVDFAIRGAANAAIALLATREGEESAMANYERQLRNEYNAYLRMARYWYGNNRSVRGFFWEAHQLVPPESVSTPLRAFVYLTSGRYAADQHFRIFDQWQEKKMFKALGVEKRALKSALAASKSKVNR